MTVTLAFVLWVTVAPVGGIPHSVQLEKPFATKTGCVNAGLFVVDLIQKWAQKKQPNTTFIYSVECIKQERTRT